MFVEVKTRLAGNWTRPAAAVNARKRRLLTKCAFDYLRLLKNPPIKIRFDVVEVLLQGGAVAESAPPARHLHPVRAVSIWITNFAIFQILRYFGIYECFADERVGASGGEKGQKRPLQ